MSRPRPPAANVAARRDFATLDGLRGVAAATVVIFHFPQFWAPLGVPAAYLAVDLFFLMSGFIVEHAYRHRLASGLGAGQFMLIRVFRLYPLYALGTALTATAIAATLLSGGYRLEWTVSAVARSIACSALMLPTPGLAHTAALYPLNVPAWSLFYELLVNLFFAATYRWWTSRRLGAVVAIGGAGIAIACWINGDLDLGSDHGALPCFAALSRVGFSFFLGVLANRRGWHERAPVVRTPPALVLGMALLLLVVPLPPQLRGVGDLLRVVVAFPIILALAVTHEPRRGRRAFLWLGLASYAVYAVHEPLLRIVSRIDGQVLRGALGRGAPFTGVVSMVVLFLVAAALDRFYDTPIRRSLSRSASPHRP